MFERFTRGKTSVPGGSGLGLALVRESVVGLGGSAQASESRWGGLSVVGADADGGCARWRGRRTGRVT